MKYVLGLAALLAGAAFSATTADACESCISDGKLEVACIDSPGAGGEICTSGGGHCNQEGRCRTPMAADGSVLAPDDGEAGPARTVAGDAPVRLVRRECDGAVVERAYSTASANQMRGATQSLTI